METNIIVIIVWSFALIRAGRHLNTPPFSFYPGADRIRFAPLLPHCIRRRVVSFHVFQQSWRACQSLHTRALGQELNLDTYVTNADSCQDPPCHNTALSQKTEFCLPWLKCLNAWLQSQIPVLDKSNSCTDGVPDRKTKANNRRPFLSCGAQQAGLSIEWQLHSGFI